VADSLTHADVSLTITAILFETEANRNSPEAMDEQHSTGHFSGPSLCLLW